MKIYISGRMTGLTEEEWTEQFEKGEKEMASLGHTIINPAAVEKSLPRG